MRVDVFSIMYNEEEILPYFLRHYETFADRIFIFDNHSTDRTVAIAMACPKVTVLPYPYRRGIYEEDFSECFQNAYKEHSRGKADWVMCVDADEFIYHKNIKEFLALQTRAGRKILRLRGFDMVCDRFPTTKGQIYDECKLGTPNTIYNKMIVLNPELDVVFGQGRHKIELIKGIDISKVDLLLLHYKYLSKEFFTRRSSTLLDRKGFNERRARHGLRRGLNKFTEDFKRYLVEVIK